MKHSPTTIRHGAWLGLFVALPTMAATAVLTGTPPRPLTDPKSIESPQGAGPVARPLKDFFKSATSWSGIFGGDCRSVVYSSDVTGRMNLWLSPLDCSTPAV